MRGGRGGEGGLAAGGRGKRRRECDGENSGGVGRTLAQEWDKVGEGSKAS